MGIDVLFILGLLGVFFGPRLRPFGRELRLRKGLIHDTPSKVRRYRRKKWW